MSRDSLLQGSIAIVALVSFILTNGGQMADYRGFGKAKSPMLPSIGVPTTAGTGSEAQSYALIADKRTHMKMACGDRKAAFRAVILDPEVTISQPRSVTAITGVDAMAHALESYVCAKRNPMAQFFARQAWGLLDASFEAVLQQPKDLEARASMQLGAHYAGAAIEHSMLGACHACANPLTARYGLTHGIAIGIMLPHVLRFNDAEVGWLYTDLAGDSGSRSRDLARAGDWLAGRIEGCLAAADMPRTLKAAGVERSSLPAMADEAAEQWTGKHNPIPVGAAELLGLYERAYE